MRPGVLFAAGLLAASGIFAAMAATLPPGSRLVPLAVAAPVTALLLLQLAREGAGPGSPGVSRSEIAAVGWVATLGMLVLLAGLLAGPALFVVSYLRTRSGERWTVALVAGFATAVLFWLVVSRLLGAAMPHGITGSFLGSLLRR